MCPNRNTTQAAYPKMVLSHTKSEGHDLLLSAFEKSLERVTKMCKKCVDNDEDFVGKQS
jgi:hypothetical protein